MCLYNPDCQVFRDYAKYSLGLILNLTSIIDNRNLITPINLIYQIYLIDMLVIFGLIMTTKYIFIRLILI